MRFQRDQTGAACARHDAFSISIKELPAEIRRLIHEADPEIVEEVKWRKPSNDMRGVPVWSHDGIICTGETYKDKVKLTFAKGASLEDPTGLFNASLTGNTRRAIDLHEGDALDQQAFKKLIQAAISNASSSRAERAPRKAPAKGTNTKSQRSAGTQHRKSAGTAKPKLLSGGNPQIPKADGDAPVQDYINAMPGWKQDIGRQLDELITRTVPQVRKAVRWNSPFYGIEGQGWFLSFHCFTKYIKVTFLNGASLNPPPPVKSKHVHVRYFHIHESDEVDEALLKDWFTQAAEIPGEELF